MRVSRNAKHAMKKGHREEVMYCFQKETQQALIYILLFYTDSSSSSIGFSKSCSAIRNNLWNC